MLYTILILQMTTWSSIVADPKISPYWALMYILIAIDYCILFLHSKFTMYIQV